ncbi:FMN-binding protein [Streptomyces olivochromogenes]|uniref:FMN-binding protein n=1 Tax=Streptomyces olivochromogenes TaxID=1963 RepID=UPI001F16BF64|nr:FMN-binding protein [Streptomyces olivochromogenes]MCF3129919.1 FMN-binding protein [Streptomyces olivochromogenes]
MHPLRKNHALRRTVLAGAATVCGMVLLLSLKPHTGPTLATAQTTSPSVSGKSPSVSGGSTPSGGASRSTGSTGRRSVTGDTVQTRWGPVRVRVTIADGRLTDVTAVDYPRDNPRDQEINGYALPALRREALSAQSADIDVVSGATYTSTGYRQSLQSALDSAGR